MRRPAFPAAGAAAPASAGGAKTRIAALLRPPTGGFNDIGLDWTWHAAAAFVCGIAGARVINLIGEVYIGELLLIQFALMLLLFGRNRTLLTLPAFGLFVQTGVLMLFGFIISDFYRDTHPAQFLRGWARVILVMLDFIAIAVVVTQDKRNLWWLVLGLALGGILQLLVRGVPIMSPAGWKFGFSTPIAYLLACLCCLMPIKLASLAFAVLGVWNIFMDFRIMGAVCILIAAILWARSDGVTAISRRQMLRLAATGFVAASLVGISLLVTEGDFAHRREQSNVGREVGLSVAAWAISESPLIGYGSWPTDPALVNLYRQELYEENRRYEKEARTNVFTAHSQVLQGWVEGGLLGAIFWFCYGYWLIRAGKYTALSRAPDAYMPIFLLFIIYNFWHLLMSPFSGPTRLPIALALAIICVCAAEMRQQGAAPGTR